jgi:hypothetical protein
MFAQRERQPPQAGASIAYADAAAPGLPARQIDLLKMLDATDTLAMRRHAWTVWAAMTQPTSGGFPRYLTWYEVSETFGPAELLARRTFAPEFRIPSQKNIGSGDAILSFNLYNDSFRYHVRRNGYQSKQKLLQMAASGFSDVADFPSDAISVKTVWWPVRRDGLTAFPVWDDMPTRPITWGRGDRALVAMGAFQDLPPAQQEAMKSHEEEGNDFEAFARVVAIDPRRARVPAGETAEVKFFDPQDAKMQRITTRPARVVPMSRLFTVQVNDPKLVEWINNLPLADELTVRMWGRKFEAGDYVALVASHVSTREIPDWVWFTVYWHDEPDQAPLGSDRIAQVPGVFRNYKMHSVFHAELPKEPDGHNAIAFNPYLEAAFAYGPKSNCAACHQRAVITPSGPGDVFPVHLGYMPKNDPYYKGKLRLDTSWSLAFETK